MGVTVAVPDAKVLPGVPSITRPAVTAQALSIAIYLHDLTGGGVERQSLIIAEEFRRSGADVTLVLHRMRGPLLDQVPAGLRVVDLKADRTLQDIPRLAQFLRQAKPDILLANLDVNNIAALLARTMSFTQTKVVICQHNPISESFVNCEKGLYRYVGLAYRTLSPVISKAVAVSAGVAQELHSIGGIPACRIVTINNPVVGPDFETRAEAEVQHPWFGQPDQPLFVTAGRLVAAKDHATMIEALAIHRRRRQSRLLILGAGPLEAELKAQVSALGLGDAVDFLGFQPNALPYFRKADAFLLTSRAEGFGNVLVEAMGCGTPVISTRCEHGPAEILDDGRYGMLVPVRDPSAFAAAMDQVMTLRARFPSGMLREKANAFSYAACASRYMAVFKALVPHRAWAAQA